MPGVKGGLGVNQAPPPILWPTFLVLISFGVPEASGYCISYRAVAMMAY
jgi:hypothetical protein